MRPAPEVSLSRWFAHRNEGFRVESLDIIVADALGLHVSHRELAPLVQQAKNNRSL